MVGGILEKDGKVLLVKEADTSKFDFGKWGLPAGAVDPGENPVEAVSREVREEAGLDFTPTHIVGIYSMVRKDLESRLGQLVQRVGIIFTGTVKNYDQENLHSDVSETKWFNPDDIYAMDQETLRTTDGKKMLKDYFSGKRLPLDTVTHMIQS